MMPKRIYIGKIGIRKLTEKTKLKISKALKGNKNNLGKILSEETKSKISKAHIKISLKQEDQIIKLYQNGLTAVEIMKRFNIGRDAIYNCLKRNNIKKRSVGHRKGKPSWNKGIKFSEEQKKKLNMEGLKIGRGLFKGKTGVYSEEVLEKMSKFMKTRIGEKAHNWRGGISRIYKTGYNSIQYKEWRKKVFKRDDYTCQKCGIRCGNGKVNYLTAHHKKSFSKHPKLRFNVNNGMTLCELCHCQIDKYRARLMKLEAQIV